MLCNDYIATYTPVVDVVVMIVVLLLDIYDIEALFTLYWHHASNTLPLTTVVDVVFALTLVALNVSLVN